MADVQEEAEGPRVDPFADESKLRVKKSIIGKAIRALLQVMAKKNADNLTPLLAGTAPTVTLYFDVAFVKTKKEFKPFIIQLPHPIYGPKSEICFISKEPQKKYKELLLETYKVPGITKVLGYQKLQKNYPTFKSKMELCDAFDLFLIDMDLQVRVPQICGSVFLQKKRKIPVPVYMRPTNPVPYIERAINGTPWRQGSGPCVGVKIGNTETPAEHLIANAIAVITKAARLTTKTPLQAISVKATEGPALPIWRRPRPPGPLLDRLRPQDGDSSAASDAGVSGVTSETEATGESDIPSDAGETLSTRDSISEVGISDNTGSELETLSELDSNAGDDDRDDISLTKERLPLLSGLKAKKRRRAGADASVAAAAQVAASEMAPPAVPKKKAKKAA